MYSKDLILGIDTSNYKTSLALTDKKGDIIIDSRRSLVVKQGERGLRQSHALFQHIDNIPIMVQELFSQIEKERIGAIAVSSKPRPQEGSYMPVFKAGKNYGSILSATLDVPMFLFSHQEGHLEAVKYYSSLSQEKEFLAYHLSGGTCELLHIEKNVIKIIGGTKDISFGQLIDRIGVAMNMSFPAGMELDKLALKVGEEYNENQSFNNRLKKIPLDGLYINLSGIETQCLRGLEQQCSGEGLIYELFSKISECLCQITEKAILNTGCNKVLFSGGVSASMFIRDRLLNHFNDKTTIIEFGIANLSSDNAVGISLLGGKKWALNQ